MTFQSSVAVEYILHIRILCHVVIFMNADGNKNMSSNNSNIFHFAETLILLTKILGSMQIPQTESIILPFFNFTT